MRVLILDTPSQLSVRTGRVVFDVMAAPYTAVKLDHHCGTVYCWPSEIVADDLPEWLPVWLKLWIKQAGRAARRRGLLC